MNTLKEIQKALPHTEHLLITSKDAIPYWGSNSERLPTKGCHPEDGLYEISFGKFNSWYDVRFAEPDSFDAEGLPTEAFKEKDGIFQVETSLNGGESQIFLSPLRLILRFYKNDNAPSVVLPPGEEAE